MTSTPPTEITAADWLRVRNAVATAVRRQTTTNKTREVAEELLGRGWIDVDAVLADITPRQPEPSPDAEPVEHDPAD